MIRCSLLVCAPRSFAVPISSPPTSRLSGCQMLPGLFEAAVGMTSDPSIVHLGTTKWGETIMCCFEHQQIGHQQDFSFSVGFGFLVSDAVTRTVSPHGESHMSIAIRLFVTWLSRTQPTCSATCNSPVHATQFQCISASCYISNLNMKEST